jgi:hypothetical protein
MEQREGGVDKLLKTTKSTAIPLNYERDGLFKIVDVGGEGKKVYVHPSVSEDDIPASAVVTGGMPLRVLLLDF